MDLMASLITSILHVYYTSLGILIHSSHLLMPHAHPIASALFTLVPHLSAQKY